MSTTPRTPLATEAGRSEVQLPNPPAAYPQLGRGASQADAVQHAEREVSSGALDDAGVAAGEGHLPYERIRHAMRRIERVFIAGQRAETEGVGDALVVRAKRGEFTSAPASLQNTSLKGAMAERRGRKAAMRQAVIEHDAAVAVLEGARPDAHGCMRPGDALAVSATDPAVLRRRLILAKVAEWMPPLLLLLVEGTIVAGNMRKYLRVDDADMLTPIGIAAVTVAIITLAPFFIGRLANDAAHGRRLSSVHRIAMVAAGAVWIGAAVLMAMIRVSVDRAEAVAKALGAEYARVAAARALGQAAEALPIDPDAVFDPLVPTLFWATVFVGFGVVMALIEIAVRNPARVEELARRIAVLDARARLLDATEYVAGLTGTVSHQRRLVGVADRQWQEELELADAAAELDIATHLQALAQHAGSPDMQLAIERRVRARETRGQGAGADSADVAEDAQSVDERERSR